MDTTLSRAIAGDSTAWAALVANHAPVMRGVASRMVGAMTADDAVQDALVQAWHHGGRFVPKGEPETALRGWLVRITVHAALARRRRDHRDQEHVMSTIGTSAEPTVRDQTFAQVALADLLADLPERHRSALELHYLAGLDHQDLAATWRCSPGAARVRVHRALAAARSRAGGALAVPLLLSPMVAEGAGIPASWSTPPCGPAPVPFPLLTASGVSMSIPLTVACCALISAGAVGFVTVSTNQPATNTTDSATSAATMVIAPPLSEHWRQLPCGQLPRSVTIATIAEAFRRGTGRPVTLTEQDEYGILRTSSNFSPADKFTTLGEVEGLIAGNWRILVKDDAVAIIPEPLPRRTAQERAQILADSPIDLKVTNMSLEHLAKILSSLSNMPIRLEGHEGLPSDRRIISGSFRDKPVQEGLNQMVSDGRWEADFDAVPNGVLFRLVPTKAQTPAGVN